MSLCTDWQVQGSSANYYFELYVDQVSSMQTPVKQNASFLQTCQNLCNMYSGRNTRQSQGSPDQPHRGSYWYPNCCWRPSQLQMLWLTQNVMTYHTWTGSWYCFCFRPAATSYPNMIFVCFFVCPTASTFYRLMILRCTMTRCKPTTNPQPAPQTQQASSIIT